VYGIWRQTDKQTNEQMDSTKAQSGSRALSYARGCSTINRPTTSRLCSTWRRTTGV